MKEYVSKFLLIIAILFSFQGTCTKPEIEIAGANKTKLLKHNYIIVNTVNNTPVDVEVNYSVYDVDSGKNIVKTQTLITPFLIGGEEVQVTYDSLLFVKRDKKRRLSNKLKRDYSPKGADYLSIKNSSGIDLEYCTIGNEPIKYQSIRGVDGYEFANANEIDKSKVIRYSPTPIYKGTPVLYLVKPTLAPQENVYVARSNGTYRNGGFAIRNVHAQATALKTPTFGEVTLHTPFSLPEMMALYKKEFTVGKVLYEDYSEYDFSFFSGMEGNNSLKNRTITGLPKESHYYGKIPAGKTLQNTGQMWFINTVHGFDEFDHYDSKEE